MATRGICLTGIILGDTREHHQTGSVKFASKTLKRSNNNYQSYLLNAQVILTTMSTSFWGSFRAGNEGEWELLQPPNT